MKTFVELVTEIKKSFDNADDVVRTLIENDVETTSIATASHATGSYLIYNKKLYKVTDDIAVGDTLDPTPTTGNIEESDDLMAMLEALRTRNQAISDEIADMNNVYGSKNLLILTSYSKGETVSLNGGTIKCNEDGSYTINGTFTSDAALKIDWLVNADRREISNLRDKILIASCNGYNTSDIQFYTGCFKTDGTASQVGSGAYGGTPRQYTMPSDAYIFRNWISIAAKTYSNVTIYPMVCLASVYKLNSDWQSPAKTNQQLTQDTTALLDNLEVNGAVNMAPINLTTQVDGIYSYTVAADKTISAVVSSATSLTLKVISPVFTLKAGTYKLSGTPVMSGSTADLQLFYSDDSAAIATEANNQGKVFTLTTDASVKLRIIWHSNVTAGTYVFKPMITVPSYTGPYVPYAKSNKELTEDFIPKVLTVTPNSSYVDNNNLCATKYGQLVILSGYFRVHTEAARGEVLYTLPSSVGNFSGNASGLALGNNGSAILLIIGDDNTLKVEASDGISTAWYSIMMVMLNKTENI